MPQTCLLEEITVGQATDAAYIDAAQGLQ